MEPGKNTHKQPRTTSTSGTLIQVAPISHGADPSSHKHNLIPFLEHNTQPVPDQRHDREPRNSQRQWNPIQVCASVMGKKRKCETHTHTHTHEARSLI